jgi:hypothetical protein
MKRCTSRIGLLMACVIGGCSVAAAAQPAAPPAPYTIEAEYTQKSPDGATTIEQYVNEDDWTWQFWMRREGAFMLLDTDPGYSANFIFINDQNWIIREQKIGSGTSTLHLYHLTPQGYQRANKKPLGELAWDYMKSRPDWRKLVKAPEYHDSAYLAEGLEENYRRLGVDWPANRYLVITLSADADVRGRKPMQTGVVNGWRCRYDLQTGKFDVPAAFSRDNAKALVPE